MKRICILLFILLLIIIPNDTYGSEQTTYRALLIGNGTYWAGDSLVGPINDLVKMENTLRNNYFGRENQGFESIVKKRDMTKNQMINSIREEFKDVKEGDVSYFYYSGHGAFNTYTNTSYLIGVDGLGLSVHELELELRNVPGTVIIILDSCHSGGFINRSQYTQSIETNNEENHILQDFTEEYNNSIIDMFSQKKGRSYLTNDKYKVITSASMYRVSYEIGYIDGWGWGGELTRAFATGTGYNDEFLADINYDGNVTLNEVYNYSKNEVKRSNVQVYPERDNYVVGSSYELNPNDEAILWDISYDIPVDKIWEVMFNMDLDEASWKDKV